MKAEETITLYHFCSKRHIESIRSTGLMFGKIPILKKGGSLKGFVQPAQWLTSNPGFYQSWQENSTLPYKRNDFRIKLELPLNSKHLHLWNDLCRSNYLQQTAEVLNSFGDPENWWVWFGTIHPNCFIEIEKRHKTFSSKVNQP